MKDHNPARRLINICAPLLMGLAAFYILFPEVPLNPTETSWIIGQGDVEQSFIGWHYFRNSPWQIPPGLNPDYGLELANAIVFTDSNPLLAILFKTLEPWLPAKFQYMGIWILCCLALQAWFAWQLIALKTQSLLARLLGTGLILLAPPLYWRAGLKHFNLLAHFLILAALYLVLRPGRSRWAWVFLACAAALIHFYLLVMVLALWAADLAHGLWHKTLSCRECGTSVLLVLAPVLACMWLAGYFSAFGAASATGYGFHRMNLLSLVDSGRGSFILPDIPTTAGEDEGFNYLGLGVILLILFAAPTFWRNRRQVWLSLRARPFLLILCAGLTLFAITPSLSFGPWHLNILLPAFLQDIVNILRAAGRMFWPVFYLLYLAIIYFVLRFFRLKQALCLLALALLIQIVDNIPGWETVRHMEHGEELAWQGRLKSGFWPEAFASYARIRYIPPRDNRRWAEVGRLAAEAGLPVDYPYLARRNRDDIEKAQSRAWDVLRHGPAEQDTLYIMDPRSAALAMESIDRTRDLLARVDGFTVLAPGWKTRRHAGDVPEFSTPDLPLVESGQKILFKNAASPYLLWGWADEEIWGTWTEGKEAYLWLNIGDQRPAELLLEVQGFVPRAHPLQRAEIFINDVRAESLAMDSPTPIQITVPIPPEALDRARDGLLRLKFELPDAISVRKVINSEDQRELGIGLVSLTLR